MALSSTLDWDVRTTGSDTNGGAFKFGATGTDFSVQDAAQITYTDLAIGGTNTQLTSTANAFTSAHVGNTINVTGGSGFTTGRYEVVSVAGSTATMDRAVGTASSTGGTGKLGGGLQTIPAAVTAAATLNRIYIKSGTYTIASTIQAVGKWLQYHGYGTTHADRTAKPTLTTTTASMNLFTQDLSCPIYFDNIQFTNTSSGAKFAVCAVVGADATVIMDSCVVDAWGVAVYSTVSNRHILLINTEIKNCSSDAVVALGQVTLYGCYVHHCTGAAANISAIDRQTAWVRVTRSIIANNVAGLTMSDSSQLFLEESVIANQSSHGIACPTSYLLWMANSILYGNGGYGINATTWPYFYTAYNCAFGANTSGNRSVAGKTGLNEITLTATPFTNSASGDFSLNTTAGGGLACKAAGLPNPLPGGLTANLLDVGASQSGGGGGGGLKTHPGMTGGING